jgi:ferredoxin
MAEKHLGITRRNFVVASSVAAATPLFLNPKELLPEAKKVREGKLYYITNECVGCQTCRTLCPGKAINFGDCRNEIDQEKCIHCGTCYNACPVSAISETD